MMAQIQNRKWMSTQLTADWKGRLQTASLTLGNPDLIHGQGVGVFHYLRAVTPRLALGAELAYQAAPQIPGGHIAGMFLCICLTCTCNYILTSLSRRWPNRLVKCTRGTFNASFLCFIKITPALAIETKLNLVFTLLEGF